MFASEYGNYMTVPLLLSVVDWHRVQYPPQNFIQLATSLAVAHEHWRDCSRSNGLRDQDILAKVLICHWRMQRLKKMYLEEKLKAEIANEYLAKK